MFVYVMYNMHMSNINYTVYDFHCIKSCTLYVVHYFVQIKYDKPEILDVSQANI